MPEGEPCAEEGIRQEGRPGNDPAFSQSAHDTDSVPQTAEGGGGRRSVESRRRRNCSICIRALNFEVEVTDRFDRHIDEDTGVGAYIALVDGERREQARTMARAVRAAGLHHAAVGAGGLAPHHRSRRGEHAGRSQTASSTWASRRPAFYAKQVTASLIQYGMSLLPPFFGGLMAYDARSHRRLRLPRAPGRPVLSQVARRASCSSSTSARASSATTCATPTSTSATC